MPSVKFGGGGLSSAVVKEMGLTSKFLRKKNCFSILRFDCSQVWRRPPLTQIRQDTQHGQDVDEGSDLSPLEHHVKPSGSVTGRQKLLFVRRQTREYVR